MFSHSYKSASGQYIIIIIYYLIYFIASDTLCFSCNSSSRSTESNCLKKVPTTTTRIGLPVVMTVLVVMVMMMISIMDSIFLVGKRIAIII